MMKRAVFFDRDGTLCRDADYLSEWEEFDVFPEIHEVRRLREHGYLLIGITNQSGIARGLVQEKFVNDVSDYFIREHGFDGFYYCPHHPDDACDCRKPSPGMLHSAAEEHGIDLGSSYFVGDRDIDMLVAKAAGAKGVLVRTGYVDKSETADYIADGLKEAVDWIIEDGNRQK